MGNRRRGGNIAGDASFTLVLLPAEEGAAGLFLAACRASGTVVKAAIPGVEISRDRDVPTEE